MPETLWSKGDAGDDSQKAAVGVGGMHEAKEANQHSVWMTSTREKSEQKNHLQGP